MRSNAAADAAADAATNDPFELLPLEVNVHILSFVDSPRELYRLIRASRFLFQLFCYDREKYLSSALRQCFDRANLMVALRILKAGRLLLSFSSSEPCVEFKTPEGSGRADWIMKHIRVHAKETGSDLPENPLSTLQIDIEEGKKEKKKKVDGRKKGEVSEADLTDYCTRLGQLCRLWGIIDYFIRDYSQQVLGQANRIRLPLVNETSRRSALSDEAIYKYGLSRVEYDRMQRAFLYFELYRRLFGGQEPYISPEESEDDIGDVNTEQSNFSMILLFSHEITELASVYEYLARRMAQVFVHVEAYTNGRMDIVEEESLRCNGGGSAARPDDVDGDVIEKSMKEGRLIRRLRSLLEDGDLRRPETLAFLVEFGLPFCKRFFFMPVARQASIIYRYRSDVRHPSLAHTLMLTVAEGEEDPKYEKLRNPPRFRTGSIGWKTWQNQPEGSACDRDIYRAQYGLGLIGYFFWDDERFEGLLHGREADWPLRIGCFLLKEAGQSGFKEYITAPYYVGVVNPYWFDSEEEEEEEKKRKKKKDDDDDDAALPVRELGIEILGLAEVEDVREGIAKEEFDNDSILDDVFAKADRGIQSPMIKDMPPNLSPEWKTDLEIDSYDY